MSRGITMFKIKEVLRLHYELNLSQHDVSASLNISSGSVNKYIRKFELSGLTWPVPDDQLVLIFPKQALIVIDFGVVHMELKRHKHMTMQLLWDEYIASGKTELSYSHFARQYRDWRDIQPQSMRQTHIAGEKIFVDYSGDTVAVTDSETGEVRQAQIFVGVLGASSYIYMEATWSQRISDWIGSHVRMLNRLGGCPTVITCDNLKSAISYVSRYEPEINKSYAEFARHYGIAIVPARPYKPKDKAKAENGVLIVQRWALMSLRNMVFNGLAELNVELRRLMQEINNRSFKKIPGTRQSAFESIDKPALKPLPAVAYVFKQYKKGRVGIDYHVELLKHYYSVPYQYIGQTVDIWYNDHLVSIYVHNNLIAQHISAGGHGTTSLPVHMPEKHKKQIEWTDERCIAWAKTVGVATWHLVEQMLVEAHSENARRSCLGLMGLAKKYGTTRLEEVCCYGLQIGVRRRKHLIAILEHNLDRKQSGTDDSAVIYHENIRGSKCYS